MKYKGTYRLKPNLDVNTNDFPRDESGSIEKSYDDIYIACSNGGQIYYYGKGILEAYIPSLGRGRNIIIKIYNQVINSDEDVIRDYEKIYKELTDNGIIFNIVESDEEVIFRFKDNSIKLIADIMKASTYGAGISPYSSKNIPKPKIKYEIPMEDLELYKQITSVIDKANIRLYVDINNGFIDKLVESNKEYTLDKIKADMRKSGLKTKEYFHSIGVWQEYINYIEGELEWRE